MYYGLDALAHGAVAALVALLPALLLFWRITAPLAAGPRALRPFVTGCAAFGVVMAVAGTYALGFERSGFADEAMGGALIAGGAAILVAFLILLLLPRKA
ncbi:hypothetical protein J5Y09_07470 [Roseomonas sp. PWR1]|uniref:Uncharacterized protein n=1 Tax=Roseomonas nitratireducens TaxID=2820810 RepID=A0ABS4AQW2_9PROT|nr:hypothetical protein [Neoroseomonas nitratireducens]MBP0463745.1 hypothetical protein [Neoroseomonas nitratireducens]